MIDLDYRGRFEEFNRIGIDYLVVGGLAVNFHGVPRMTYDVDIMILMDSANIFFNPFHRALVHERHGLVRDAEIAEKKLIYGESKRSRFSINPDAFGRNARERCPGFPLPVFQQQRKNDRSSAVSAPLR